VSDKAPFEKRKQEGSFGAGGAKPEPMAGEITAMGYVSRAPAPSPALPPPPQAAEAEADRLGERELAAEPKKVQALPPSTTTVPGAKAAEGSTAAAAPTVAAAPTPGPERNRDVVAYSRTTEQADDGLYGALVAQRSDTVESARKAREAWRGYVAAQPAGPRADVARVRTIEAGMAAWQLSREEQDRVVVLRDIAAYLDRRDSRQAERVRSLRQRIEPR
jgi:hypothetical protein